MPCSALYYLLHVFDPTGLPNPRRFFGNQRWQCSSGSCCSSFSLVFMTLFTYIFLISIYPVTVTHLLDSGKNQRLALDSLYFYSEAQSDPERLRSSKWRRPTFAYKLHNNGALVVHGRRGRQSHSSQRSGQVAEHVNHVREPSTETWVTLVRKPYPRFGAESSSSSSSHQFAPGHAFLWVWWVSILEVKHFVKNLLFKMRRKKKDYFIHGLLIFGTVCFLAKLFCHAHINIYYALLF